MSDQITKDLGGITAYAAAVAAGYTGTKAQFETLMASYATVAQNAAASATAAASSKSDAEAYAVGKRNGTDVGSSDATYHNNSKYYAEQAEAFADSIDPDTLAKIDGYYDTLGAGTAEQLTSNIYEEDSVPYNFRTSGGSIDIGDRETDMLVGGTVGWNQLGDVLPNATRNGLAYSTSNGKISITGTVQGAPAYGQFALLKDIQWQRDGRKYLVTLSQALDVGVSGFNHTVRNAFFYTATASTPWVGYVNLHVEENEEVNISNLSVQIFDLTQMLGSTIADYIYSLEQATAGAGVAWFRKLFPKPYYEYNAGELMSVNASSHDMVGFNAWDEELEVGSIDGNTGENQVYSAYFRSKNYIPVFPSTSYYINSSGTGLYVYKYDAEYNFLGYTSGQKDRIYATSSDTHYIRFVNIATNKYDPSTAPICINLSWDGERDGEYEAYVKHSYALDSSLTLRGIPKLDANNNLYYDGDEYESDGTVTRKYGVVDLGTLTYSSAGANILFYTSDVNTLIRKASGTAEVLDWVVCSSSFKYVSYSAIGTSRSYEMCVSTLGNILLTLDTGRTYTPAEVAAALSGVYLVYELATPTTETADAYTNPQIVNDFGTEEYVDYAVSQGDRDVSIPVGHQTQYMANLKAKLEMSPNSPEGAGDYIVRQTNGENEYVALASNATIQDIIARLEALEGGGE